MHDFAVRGGPPEFPRSRGCFLLGGAAVGALALHRGPGIWPMISVALMGVMLLLPQDWLKRVGHRRLMALVLLPILGVFTVLLQPKPELWGFQMFIIFPQFFVLFFASVRWSRLVGLLETPKVTHQTVEQARAQSVAGFESGRLEEARSLAQGALAGPIDLEEGRQLRAWLAYLELAAGRPAQAALLAEAAIGPQVMAGEEWLAYCRALHAWALWEQGLLEEAATEARFYYANTPHAGEIRQALTSLATFLDEELAARQGKQAESPDVFLLRDPIDQEDSFRVGLRARRLAKIEERGLAQEAGQRAFCAANSPYARARALVDQGWVALDLGDPVEAREKLHEALELWPTLPAALSALAAVEERTGNLKAARALRSESRCRFPEYGAALKAGVTGLPA